MHLTALFILYNMAAAGFTEICGTLSIDRSYRSTLSDYAFIIRLLSRLVTILDVIRTKIRPSGSAKRRARVGSVGHYESSRTALTKGPSLMNPA